MEEWAQRVQQYELSYARRQIANGADPNLVMEAMAARIQKKFLHPIIVDLKKHSNPNDKYWLTQTRKNNKI